jgi:hypothetical protein
VDGELDDVEGVGDERRGGQRQLEGAAVGTGEVEGAGLDVGAPPPRPPAEPPDRSLGRPSLDHVQQTAATDVDD